MTSQDIDIPIESINVLCRRYQVRELALFGSALGGSFGPDSDLDFLVEFQPEAQVGFMKLARMQREFSAVLNRKVDLVPKGGLKPKYAKQYFPVQKYSMRREELYLTDMVEAADAISQFVLGVEQDAFSQNDLLRSAVLQKLIIIGEGAITQGVSRTPY